MRERALEVLRSALGRSDAEFRDGQWEAIEGLLARRRMLVVQRTGWGKSMVYFITTRLLRDRGAGFSLIVSPLLSLMRNQLEAAARIGIRAATINSTNKTEWASEVNRIRQDEIDLLFVAPERLADEEFVTQVLAPHAGRMGLLTIDEAHCISDWGHDFRPNYRRIGGILKALPGNVPVLATTATANDRVVGDVCGQLGPQVEVVRGPLARKSLRLQNLSLPSPAARMAWLAEHLPAFPGSGIVYALTTRDADRLADWLRHRGIDAASYHAELDHEVRVSLENRLLNNDLKALVATTALGMGFDKPDLGFVVHFQRPASVIHYYQQVGRAGRAMADALGILLHGEEDDRIVEHFRETAFPLQQNVTVILDAIENAEDGLSVPSIEQTVNLRSRAVVHSVTFLSLESPSPIMKQGRRWHATATARNYRLDEERIAAITAMREAEHAQMDEYMTHRGCLMEFLVRALNDPQARPCGRCAGCTGSPLVPEAYRHALGVEAATFLCRNHHSITRRCKWPKGMTLDTHGFRGDISQDHSAEEGRALCLWKDAGWGELVANGKQATGRFQDELVDACVEMIDTWQPMPAPRWVACVPSLRNPTLVTDFARRLADALSLPFISSVRKVRQTEPQKMMHNSSHQVRNIDGAFEVGEIRPEPCLLIDDVVNSRWTFTLVAALLRRAGVPNVFPLALARRSTE